MDVDTTGRVVAVLVVVFPFAFVDFPPDGFFRPAVWQFLKGS